MKKISLDVIPTFHQGDEILRSRVNADQTQVDLVDDQDRVRGFVVAGASRWIGVDSRGRLASEALTWNLALAELALAL